ncbi:MAG TPA: hypothetical protein RMH99_13370 [Sandaracinaceae bacterium LLY-WYZ-13_1]|nr:hypothetical protein [Sandaracinaceae bacterium LLY-WYZ-13_1]
MQHARLASLALVLALAGCDGAEPPPADAGPTDAGSGTIEPLSTDHCTYAPLPATAGAGGTVEPGPIRAGVAERLLDLPVGTALGGNTSRAVPLDDQGGVDDREVPLSGTFNPSVGYETLPKVKALALSAGDETIVLLRTDTIFSDDTVTHEVTEQLGPEYAGKVLWMSSHTHTAAEQFSADTKFQVGGGPVSARVRGRLIERLVEAAEAAIAAQVPAQVGIAVDLDFDPEDRVSYDRRDENDFMYDGEPRKDTQMAVIRVDTAEGEPMAILPVFGVHSAILDDDVAVFSTDASGAYERAIEEEFDVPITAIHLQGAAGDVLGASDSHVAFEDGQPRWDFARNEENGRWALPMIMEVWERAGDAMQGEMAMEMVTRSIEMGPDWETFTLRDGALAYAPWDGRRLADGEVWNDDGTIISPIDEFNAPAGAALCGEGDEELLSIARLPGTNGLEAYNSCAQIPKATEILGILLDMEFEAAPLCVSTRTTISALRLGDYLFATAPGEPVVPWRDYVQTLSPYPRERTFVLGYAQGHNGYLLTPEDWLQGGYEPSINSWGPLEGEYVAERLGELMQLAVTDAREDAAADGADRVVAQVMGDPVGVVPDAAPMAGTVPEAVPEDVYFRGGAHPASGQPDATVPRVTGVARFVWIGEDPLVGTPRVTLQREVEGAWTPATRRSGRPVQDLDLIVVWTPLPLRWTEGEERTHHWTVEWQAVSWTGAPGLATLADRPGVPLGRYRFHVEGSGYTVDSAPFEVTPGPMQVAAAVDGDDLVLEAGWEAREGWRLLRMEGLSNRYVPSESGPWTVALTYDDDSTETFEDVALTGPGTARVTPTGAVVRAVVRDRFGNEGAVDL